MKRDPRNEEKEASLLCNMDICCVQCRCKSLLIYLGKFSSNTACIQRLFTSSECPQIYRSVRTWAILRQTGDRFRTLCVITRGKWLYDIECPVGGRWNEREEGSLAVEYYGDPINQGLIKEAGPRCVDIHICTCGCVWAYILYITYYIHIIYHVTHLYWVFILLYYTILYIIHYMYFIL